ncbi:response regulator transcription factor [Flavobacteriales bacterium]|nr:response regulator transcription factor [Flavobacteriales bacterium]
MLKNQTVLLVDDELDILDFLSYNLSKVGYNVFKANNGKDGLSLAKKIVPDLILLDVMMPEMDGMEVCENIRSISKLDDTFIVFLTARSEDYSQLTAFKLGGDDYITKPIKPKLLISRIQAILKRRSKNPSQEIIIDDLKINKLTYQLFHNSIEVNLAKKEFNLLYYLMSVPGKVFSRQEIIDEVWKDSFVGDRTIDVHVRKIREKIGDKYIKTIKGVGYKFNI